MDPEGIPGTGYRLSARLRTGEVTVWAEGVWAGEALPPRLVLGPAHPNPARDAVAVSFRLVGAAAAHRLQAEVVDAAGRRVCSLDGIETDGGGGGEVRWDGRDAAGRPVAAGLYWVRVRAGSLEGMARVIRLP